MTDGHDGIGLARSPGAPQSSEPPARYAIGVDLGGTKIAAGVVGDDGLLMWRDRVPTPKDGADSIIRAIADVAIRATGHCPEPPVGVGVGIAGLVDIGTGVFRYGPHVGMADIDLAAELRKYFEAGVRVDNDATVATLAEFMYGAGAGVGDMLLVAIGTGIGGGIVAGGRVLRGAHGYAGEFGHMFVDPGGEPAADGQTGTWESVASGSALDRRAGDLVSMGLIPVAAAGEAVRGDVLVAAARSGNLHALAALDEFAAIIARGMCGLVQAFDPELIVVGGGVAEIGDLLLERIRSSLAPQFVGAAYRPLPRIVPARMGATAGVVGAASLWFENCP